MNSTEDVNVSMMQDLRRKSKQALLMVLVSMVIYPLVICYTAIEHGHLYHLCVVFLSENGNFL